MNLPFLSNLNFSGKRILLRADLDVDLEKNESEAIRLKVLVPTLSFLKEKKCKVIIIGHKDRPQKKEEEYSLKNICVDLSKISGIDIKFIGQVLGEGVKKEANLLKEGDFLMLENLRFEPGEENNEDNFAKELSNLADIFVNESFATSHRKHSSIVGIPKFIKGYLGLRFEEEIKNLSKVFENPKKPVVAVVSGVKMDKVSYAKGLTKIVDKVLAGGRLPEYFDNEKSIREFKDNDKLIIANLIFDKEDITLHSIERFKEEIKKAKTIVLAGVLGKYEDEGHRQGTRDVFTAIANSPAFKIVGGGDSLVAIEMFNLTKNFDWVSVGGGAMLEYLVKGSLPGIEALLN